MGERINHPSHPHLLARFNDLPDPFTCSGCKEYGAGSRFTCPQCNYQLHEFCARPPSGREAHVHPLHPLHQLLFKYKTKPGGILWPRCDVCCKKVKGFRFRCSACDFRMHPCCAMLSTEMEFSIHAHRLKLLPAAATPASSSGDPSFVCGGDCKRKRSGRVYRCTVCSNFYLHAVCAKNLINGLQANGIKSPPKKPNMIGKAVRVASIVVGEFINGLVEGVGEAVGDVLVPDEIRGKHVSTTTRVTRS